MKTHFVNWSYKYFAPTALYKPRFLGMCCLVTVMILAHFAMWSAVGAQARTEAHCDPGPHGDPSRTGFWVVGPVDRRGGEKSADGGAVLEERRFDLAAGEIETTLTLVEAAGGRDSATYRMRTYTASELVELVAGAGFERVECYGDLGRTPLTIETRLAVLARAPD